jgi:nicotinamidase/pyrazinamidase
MEITAQDAFIVIDVQNDFCPGGALADGDAVIEVIYRIAPSFEHMILV